MSVRQALLALLEEGPMYGYQLRSEFERRTGRDLAAQRRAGLHDPDPARARRPGRRVRRRRRGPRRLRGHRRRPRRGGHLVHHAGRADHAAARRARDQARAGGHRARRRRRHRHPAAAQRHHVRAAGLHPAQARPRPTATPGDLAWGLVLDSLIFNAEAEVRWLDHCEARLRRAAVEASHPPPPRPPAPLRERTADEHDDDRRAPARHRHPHPRRGRDGGAGAQGRVLRRARRRAGRRHGPVRAPASRPCSPWPAASTPRRRAPSRSRAPTWRRSARRAAPGCGVRRSATSSRTST